MSTSEPSRPAVARWLLEVPLIAVVVGIVGVAFWGSWGALRDAALSIHFAPSAASAYPFAVDGLIVAALLASVVLRNQTGARRYCLGIIGGYTTASLLINFLHGLGQFQLDPGTGTRHVPHPLVVAVVASLVVSSIFLGSHLLVLVGRRRWSDEGPVTVPGEAAPIPAVPDALPLQALEAIPADDEPGEGAEDAPPVAEPPASAYAAAVAAYRYSLQHGPKPLSQQALRERFGVSKREASDVQHAVKVELGLIDAAPDGEAGGPGEEIPVVAESVPALEPAAPDLEPAGV